ncbi:MAG: hypothetical protein ACRCXL_01435 [Dermatophilaceae bacterium]
MRPNRALATLAAAAVSVGLAVSTATPASAAAGCTLSVTNRVAIARPYLELPVRASGTCTQPDGLAVWDLIHPTQGYDNSVFFAGGAASTWEVYSDTYIGTMAWRPDVAFDENLTEVSQNTAYTTVKLAAGAWISSSRSGDVVTLRGTSLLYSVGNDEFFKRPAGGVFQYRDLGSTQWKNLKSVWTTSAGTATMSYRYTPQRDYRFALYSTPISWDVGSATTRR